jgi:glycosyltransferase involved in cell wall biosynthesis
VPSDPTLFRPVRVALVPEYAGSHGGVAQYSAAIFHALEAGLPAGVESIMTLRDGAMPREERAGWPVLPLYPPSHPRRFLPLVKTLLGASAVAWAGRRLRAHRATSMELRNRPEIGRWFREQGIDLLFWTAPNPLAIECGVPFVMAVHDLQHRLQPRFPEVSVDGEGRMREHLYRNAARRATLLVADSPEGREDILAFYGDLIDPQRIAILPFVPAPHIVATNPVEQAAGVKSRFSLPDRYWFYPAQFWPHKNHEAIVRALGLLRSRGRQDIHVVFCGSHGDALRARTYRAAMQLAVDLGVAAQVTSLPYVPDEAMPGLYLGSVGLVMPTYFGPTNIPILEAWRLGRPVITSNIRGVRDQAGAAALLIDPESPEELAESMLAVWDDPILARRLAEAGTQRDAGWTGTEFAHRLRDILALACTLMRTDGGQRGRAL